MTDLENIRLQPFGSVILVLPKAAEKPKTESGIQLADVTYEPETCGLIVKLGHRFECETCAEKRDADLQIGEWVLFPRSAGVMVPLDGQDYLLLHESEVLAVVNDPDLCEVV